jgi:hypothetical protein
MSERIKLMSWILLVFAIASCAGVGYAAQMIRATALQRSNDTQLAMTKANQSAMNQKVQALAEVTKEKREELALLAAADVVTVIDTIDAAGRSAGIEAKVSDASVAGTLPLGKSGDTLRAVMFSVQGDGSMAQVMHAAQLYERLPLLSSVDQIEIVRNNTSDPKQPAWHITARIKVLTLIQVSI